MTIEGVYLGLGDEDFIIEPTSSGPVVTRIASDGTGHEVSAGRAAAVIEAACDADGRRRSA